MGPLAEDPLIPPPDAPVLHSHGPWVAWTSHWRLRPPRDTLVVTVKCTYTLVPGEAAVASEEPEPPSGDVRVEDGEAAGLVYSTDFAIYKPRADVLLTGHAYSRGDDRTVSRVRLRFGDVIDRTLVAIGDRAWTSHGLKGPVAYEAMPLVWERAFGGPSVNANPVGTGLDDWETNPAARFPNLEDPARLITSPLDRPEPVCFAPIAPEWRARASKMGDFRGDWANARWPWFPADFDYAFFNAAPPEQQVAHPRGDERFALGGVHPEVALIEGALPRSRPRVYAERRADAGGDFFEVRLALDTVHFMPDDLKVVLVWRGLLDVRDPWGTEIAALHAFAVAHDESLTLEAARERAFAVRDRVPNEEPDEAAEDTDGTVDPRVALAATGAIGTPHIAADEPPPPPPKTREDFLTALGAGAPLAGEDFHGVDLSGLDLRGRDLSGGLFDGASFAGCALDGAKFIESLLTGVDFRSASLAGADLSRADLTGSHLAGADLSNATLEEATLARSFAAHTRFASARGAMADFSGATLREADFTGASLAGADFTHCVLEDARFTSAVLDDAHFHEAWAARVTLDGASLVDFRAESADLRGARVTGARANGSLWQASRLDEARFDRSELREALFSRAVLDNASLARVIAPEANFRRARMKGTSLLNANLMKCQFEGADLERADLRNSNLYEADFRHARLDGADWELAITTRAGLDATE